MAKKHVLFWFDVEDCSVPQSDDAAKTLAEILTHHGVRGTMKLVGQKARVMRDRIRYDVIDALNYHAIGFHTNWHGGRPQPAEYMGPLDWLDGQFEFEMREEPGIDAIRELWGRMPVTYGQPGSNWSPQVFPILRKWAIPTYVSGFGYVGLRCQPFYYGGIINTSHMWGTDARGRQARHVFTLGFDLGEPQALNHYKTLFDDCHEMLEDGGLISIANHPCQLVLERWFSTDMKPRELTQKAYEQFEAFVEHVLSFDDVQTIAADDLPELYPDLTRDRVFSAHEIMALARGVGDEVHFEETDTMAWSAAELFGMFSRFVAASARSGGVPVGETCLHHDGPARTATDTVSDFVTPVEEFIISARATVDFLDDHGRLPDYVSIGSVRVPVADYHSAIARTAAHIVENGHLPDQVAIRPTANRLLDYVDEEAAHGAWRSVMMLPGFEAPKLLEQARLQAWTLKPAILSEG